MFKSSQPLLIVHCLEDRLRFAAGEVGPKGTFSRVADIPLDPRRMAGEAEFGNKLFKELERFAVGGLKNPLTVVALSRNFFIWRVFTVPPVPEDNLPDLLKFEVEKHLPVKMEETLYRAVPLGRNQDAWRILLVATRKDLVGGIAEALEMMGLRAAAVVPDIWGLGFLPSGRGIAAGTADGIIACLTAAGADVVVFGNGLPAQSKRLATGAPPRRPATAEEINNYGAATAEAVNAAVGELLGEAETAAKMPGFLIAEAGGADVVAPRLDPSPVSQWSVVGAVDLPFLAGRDGAEYPRLAHCGGVARGAAEAEASPLNLAARPKEPKRGPRRLTITVTLFVLLMAAAAFHLGGLYLARQRNLDSYDKAIAELKGKVAEIKKLNDLVRRKESTVGILEKNIAGEVSTLDALKELTNILPANAYLSQLNLKNRNMELIGFADSASDLIPKLETSPLFKNVAFDGAVTSQGQQKERFKIKLALEMP